MFKVGDKVWTFDENRRVYDGKGNFGGKVIYAGHFVQQEIVGETSRSWIVGHWKTKYPKNNPHGLYTDEQKADAIWLHDNRYKIEKMLERCRDVDVVRKVAEVLGYKESE